MVARARSGPLPEGGRAHGSGANRLPIRDHLVGSSAAMSRVFAAAESAVDSDAPVVVEGERGTGRELIARAIPLSPRRRRLPFISVKTAALPPVLARGAIAGARGRQTRGTIFLKSLVGDHAQGLEELARRHRVRLMAASELPLVAA